jgi:ABC-type dipeptide/oligopeptide/nickel transport system permease component
MLRYFVKRLAAVVPLVLLVSLICFALMQATPAGRAAFSPTIPW